MTTAPRSEIAERVKSHLESALLRQVIDTRVKLGVEKYGQTLDDNEKPDRAKAVHLIQELLDAAQYAEWLGMPQLAGVLCNDIALVERAFPDLTLDELLYKEGHSGTQAAPDERAIFQWIAGSFDSGASSESLAYAYVGLTPRIGWREPSDASDFGRCYRLLLRFPEIRPTVDDLAKISRGWAALAPIWDRLMELGDRDGLSVRGGWSEEVNDLIRQTRDAFWKAQP